MQTPSRIKIAPLPPVVRKLTFAADGYRLAGWLHHPGTPGFAVVVGAHGLESDAGSAKQRALADACVSRGIAYLRFDHRGCGHSEGDFVAVTTMAGRVADLGAAVDVARRMPGADGRIALFGSSLGAAVCMAAAEALKPAAMVLFAAPVRRRTIAGASLRGLGGVSGGSLDFDLGGELAHLHHLLVVHGTDDAVVPVADAREIFAAADDPKRLLLQPGGDHRMSNPIHQAVFVTEAVKWFSSALS
jgi:alpha-beta hydrolase superfamily lysophospholipase